MPAPTRIQGGTNNGTSVASLQVALTGVTAGSTLVVAIWQTASATRTYTTSDNQSNTYSRAGISYVSGATTRPVIIDYATNVAGGNTTITVTPSASTSFYVVVMEISASTFDVGGTFDAASSTSFHAAGVSGVNTSANIFAVSATVLIADAGTRTPGSGYTAEHSSTFGYVQRKGSDTALSGERATWTGTTARDYGGVLAAFVSSTTTPTVTTTAISNIGHSTADSGGNVTSDGGATVTARGVCWNTSPSPTTANSTTSNGTGTGAFTSNLTGLSPNTTYYVRAYATNSQGTSYGSEVSFTTAAGLPVVTTSAITSANQTSANCGGNVTDGGASAVTARGVCWNTTGTPTTADSTTSDGTGTGSYTSALSGLAAGTTYYIRAYATNTQGTSYGSEITVTTGQERWAVVAGNWSATGTWNGGTLPAQYDDVYANGYAVTLDVTPSVNTLRRTAGDTAVAGGSFVPSGGGTAFPPIGSGLVF